MWGVPSEWLLASWKTRRWVVGAWARGGVVGIPQQVDVKGVLGGVGGEHEDKDIKAQVNLSRSIWKPRLRWVEAEHSSGVAHLILLAPSLLVVVEDVVADVVIRLADKQPRSFPDVVASPTGGHGHSQQQQHCEEERHASVRPF